jgi:hypothetical protein
LAIRKKPEERSRVVHFESAAKMLDFFRLSKDGRHYHRTVQGFQRIFAPFIGTVLNMKYSDVGASNSRRLAS